MSKYNAEKKKIYYLKNKEEIRKKSKSYPSNSKENKSKYNKEYRKLNKDTLKIKDKEKHQKRKNAIREQRLQKSFGMSLKDYEEMYFNQNGLCKICNKPETAKQSNTDGVRMLAVDHCHITNKVRGLLCTNCNIILGHAKDNIEILKNAIEYLKYYNEKTTK